jgi:hypothetical protein
VRILCLDAALAVVPDAPGLVVPRGERDRRWPRKILYAPADPIMDTRRRLRNATRRARVIAGVMRVK